MLNSGESSIERAAEAKERKLRLMIRTFQNEADAEKARRQWSQIEKEVFGVEYHD